MNYSLAKEVKAFCARGGKILTSGVSDTTVIKLN